MTNTSFPSESMSLVSISLVLHELPSQPTVATLTEAYRLLKPGGVLVISEMDPSTPDFIKLRSSPVILILKSTEPYLDEYFQIANKLPVILQNIGFDSVRIGKATNRHMTILAIKSGILDLRI
mmetsp:Transcript_35628/g.36335  ORF Transcript_35628/g.36335 Transcript_35628/m.36335 type:complete len:123 (+) Transcript_35628:724-1092(+)